jgi:superfamily I DNA/RNA helicase
MANNHVEMIRKLALENSRLHDALKKAEKLHRAATGTSLCEALGIRDLLMPDVVEPIHKNVAAKKVLSESISAASVSNIPACMNRLNNVKAPAIKSNPANLRLGKYPLTDEQQQVVELSITGQNLKVEAGAGAGKTSSLTAISQNMGKRKGLYLAFNTDIIKDAKGRFHKDTSCRTTHSVAFEAAGHPFSHRLNGKLTSQIIIDALKLQDWDGISKWAQAAVLRQWVANFTQSDEPYLGKKSVPWKAVNLLTKEGDKQRAYLAAQPIVSHLWPAAVKLWDLLSNVHGNLPITPDVYLKVWALTEPQLQADLILFDEAQDTSAVTMKLINDQSCQVIWVGDRRQQIYGWRGAVNAMDAIATPHTALLTRSFRYGQPIAELANLVLTNFLNESDFKIVGSPMVESKLEEIENPKAILCRSNRGAMNELMMALKQKKKVHLSSDVSPMIMDIEACQSLMRGTRPRSPEFQSFRDWNELVEYSETEVGADLAPLVKLLNLWSAEDLLNALRLVQHVTQEEADVSICTVHKAKGREFPTVKLADDFAFPASDQGKSKIPFSAEEARIFYVGITRAQFGLDVTQCRAAHVAMNW